MPPILAASARLMPSRTAASDKSRLLCRVSFDLRASRRSSAAEESARISTADPMAESSFAQGITLHERGESPRESDASAPGISSRIRSLRQLPQ